MDYSKRAVIGKSAISDTSLQESLEAFLRQEVSQRGGRLAGVGSELAVFLS